MRCNQLVDALIKRENVGNWNTKQQIALFGEFALEGTIDLS
jgi:hypothetical protein